MNREELYNMQHYDEWIKRDKNKIKIIDKAINVFQHLVGINLISFVLMMIPWGNKEVNKNVSDILNLSTNQFTDIIESIISVNLLSIYPSLFIGASIQTTKEITEIEIDNIKKYRLHLLTTGEIHKDLQEVSENNILSIETKEIIKDIDEYMQKVENDKLNQTDEEVDFIENKEDEIE